jgi:hypothetical protein
MAACILIVFHIVRRGEARMAFQTESEFILPKGYLDSDGTLHKTGTMRLATAADEILPLKDPRVQQNPAYLTVILLSRVITSLGSLPDVNPRIVENLFASDLSYLQGLYQEMNGNGRAAMKTSCPQCGNVFDVETQAVGEA